MNVRPEERPKLIALAVGIVLVVVYFVIVVIPQFSAKPQPSTVVSAAGASTTAAAPAVAAAATPNPTTPSSAIWSLSSRTDVDESSVAVRDPFIPLKSTSAVELAGKPAPVSRPTLTSPTPESGASLVAAPIVNAPADRKNVPAPAATVSTIALNGVIMDRSAVAILRIGDQILDIHEGERLPGNLILVRITETGVRLRQGKTRLPFLEVGRTLELNTDHAGGVAMPSSSVTRGGATLTKGP